MIREEFKQLWQQFIAFCGIFLLLKWLALSMLNSAIYSVVTPFVQFILTSSLYVLMHKIFDYLYYKLIEEK